MLTILLTLLFKFIKIHSVKSLLFIVNYLFSSHIFLLHKQRDVTHFTFVFCNKNPVFFPFAFTFKLNFFIHFYINKEKI